MCSICGNVCVFLVLFLHLLVISVFNPFSTFHMESFDYSTVNSENTPAGSWSISMLQFIKSVVSFTSPTLSYITQVYTLISLLVVDIRMFPKMYVMNF